jgi:putative ABC transport system permease protein
MIWDSLQEILYSLKSNKLRTSLTAFGVFWGIFMLVLLLGAGTGLKRGLEKSFSSDLRNSIWINAFTTSVPYKGLPNGRKIQLTEADLHAVAQEIPGVDLLSAENPLGSAFRANIRVTYENQAGTFGVFGVAKNYFKIKRYQDYQLGRRLNDLDEDEKRKVAVIGTRVKERLFGAQNPLGQLIAIKGVTFTVVGVFYDSGWEGRMSERIYIPLSTFQNAFGGGEKISILAVTPKEGVLGVNITPQIEALIKRRHRVAPNDRKAIFITDLAQQSAQLNNTLNAINVFIWFVGLGTLAAGIVGISNIMMITVKERTLEIGIRKAIGASPWRIVSTILLEAVLVTGIAGYAGLVLAVGLLELVNYLLMHFNIELNYFTQPEVNFNLALAALGILIGFGLLAGFFPARRAARVSPIEAMRAHES